MLVTRGIRNSILVKCMFVSIRASGGAIKDIVDAYVHAPGQNIDQEEDAHMILAHVITRYMRHVAHLNAQTEPDGLSLRSQQIGVSYSRVILRTFGIHSS